MEGVWVYEITLYNDTNKMNANTTYKDKKVQQPCYMFGKEECEKSWMTMKKYY